MITKYLIKNYKLRIENIANDCSSEPLLDTLISLCSSLCSSSNIGCRDFKSTGGEFSE